MLKRLADFIMYLMAREASKLPESHGRAEYIETLIDRNDVEGVLYHVRESSEGVRGGQLHWLFEALLARGDVIALQRVVDLYSDSFGPEYRQQLERKLKEERGSK